MKKRFKILIIGHFQIGRDDTSIPFYKEYREVYCNGQRYHYPFKSEGYDTFEEAEHVLELFSKTVDGLGSNTFVIIPHYTQE